MAGPLEGLLHVLLRARAERVELPVAVAGAANLDEQVVERRTRVERSACASVRAELDDRGPRRERAFTRDRRLERDAVVRREAHVLADRRGARPGGPGSAEGERQRAREQSRPQWHPCHGRMLPRGGGDERRLPARGARLVLVYLRSHPFDLRDLLPRPVRSLGAGLLGPDAREVALEAARSADEQVAGRLGPEVGERVRRPPRRKYRLATARGQVLVTELERELPVEDVERLVEVVPVERRPRPAGWDQVLDHRQRPSGRLRVKEHLGLERRAAAHRGAPAGSVRRIDAGCGRAPARAVPSGTSFSPSTSSRARSASGAATMNTFCTPSITSVRVAAPPVCPANTAPRTAAPTAPPSARKKLVAAIATPSSRRSTLF